MNANKRLFMNSSLTALWLLFHLFSHQVLAQNPPVVTITASVTAQPTCALATGTITVTAPANGAGITYTVTGTAPVVAAQTNNTGVFAGLGAGSYNVTTTNATGFTSAPTALTVNAQPATPAAPTASVTAQPTGAVATGTITVTAPANGDGCTYTVTGTAPVVAAQTNNTGVFAGLAAGNYNVTTTNAVGCTSAPTALTVTVEPTPDAVADNTTTPQGTPVTVDVLGNDTDVPTEGTITTTPPVNGTVTVNDGGTPNDPSDDVVTYTPNPNFNGIDTFTYTICDAAGNCDTETVTVVVTPDAVADNTTTTQGTPVAVDVLGNDTDVPTEGTITTTPPVNGTVTVNDGGTPNDPSDDVVTYTPNPNFNGTDTFTYTICDAAGNCDTETVTVVVTPTGDILGDRAFTYVNQPVTIDILANDNNTPIAGTLTTSTPSNGTVTINDGGTPNDPSDDVVTYTPNGGYVGVDQFEYTICDASNVCQTTTVTVNVEPVPDVIDDIATTGEEEPVTIAITDNDIYVPSVGTMEATDPANGTVILNDNGTPNDPSDDYMSYTPNIGFAGVDSFEYTICDANNNCSTGTVSITVNALSTPYHLAVAGNPAVCAGSIVNLQLVADSAINRAIGLEWSLVYDPNFLRPLEQVSMEASQVIDGQLVSSSVYKANDSTLNIALSINTVASASTVFTGTGIVATIAFESIVSIGESDSLLISAPIFRESYLNRTAIQRVAEVYLKGGNATDIRLETIDGQALGYDSTAPARWLATQVFFSNDNCLSYADTLLPDTLGIIAIQNSASSIRIHRDIANSTDIMGFVNGMDAYLASQIALGNNTIAISPQQLLATDVNQDGRITAGDITQINRRSVGLQGEFAQQWNYDDQGNSTGAPSIDWGFVPNAWWQESTYQVSSIYPNDDGIGLSRRRVPNQAACLPLTSANCDTVRYTGFMMGDVDGNATIDNLGFSGARLRGEGTASLDISLAEIQEDRLISIPLFVEYNSLLVSVDMALSYDHSKLVLVSVEMPEHIGYQYHEPQEGALRLSSYLKKDLPTHAWGALIFQIKESVDVIDQSSFQQVKGYLNGKSAAFNSEGTWRLTAETILDQQLTLFPNPASDLLQIQWNSEEKGALTIRMIDITGREMSRMMQEKQASPLATQLTTAHLSPGVYWLEIKIGSQFIRKSFVKK